jgi:hypothetical protein
MRTRTYLLAVAAAAAALGARGAAASTIGFYPNPTPGPGATYGYYEAWHSAPDYGYFGTDIATLGEYFVVGAPGYVGTYYDSSAYTTRHVDTVGHAVLLDRAGNVIHDWSDPSNEAGFGVSVAAQGNVVLVGSPGYGTGDTAHDSVFAYDATSGALIGRLDGAPSSGFGTRVGFAGENYVVAAPGANAVYVYAPDGTLLRTFAPGADEGRTNFGQSLSIDGNRIAIGAGVAGMPGYGVTYLYDATTGALVKEIGPIAGSFGAEVQLGDGYLAVGAPRTPVPYNWAGYDNYQGGGADAGAVHLYDAATGDPVLVPDAYGRLQPEMIPSPVWNGGYGYFGSEMAFVGGVLAVYSAKDWSGGMGQGSVNLFDPGTGKLLVDANGNPAVLGPDPAYGWYGNSSFGAALAADPTNPAQLFIGQPGWGGTSYYYEGASWLYSIDGFATAATTGGGTVPEPAAVALLAVGCAIGARRRGTRGRRA